MGESGPEAEPTMTVNQMFTSTVQRFGNYNALGWKEGEQWKTMTYSEYYKSCRTAAKSFLKVRAINSFKLLSIVEGLISLFVTH